MEFKKININSSIEKRVLTGMIVCKEFMSKTFKAYQPEYIESSYIRKTIKWVLDYYEQYGDVPGDSIKEIYISNKKKLSDEEFEIVGMLIEDILTGYAEGSFSSEYVTDQVLNFFKTRELTIVSNNIKYFLDKGNIVDAEKEIENYARITKPNLEINGFIASEEALIQTFDNEEDNNLLTIPRSLGKFMGPFQREWLVGISAPFKKGKCLSSDQLILLSNGQLKTVEHIVQNKLTGIVTYNESMGQFQKGEILDWYNNGEKEIFRVTTRTGREVDITSNHPLLTEKGWIELSELQINDRIAVPRILDFFGNKIIKDYKIKVLAYLLADGGLTQQYYTTFTKNEDIVRDDFINSVSKFGDKCSIVSQKTKRAISVSIVGGNVNSWLHKIGVKREKSINKVIPNIVFELPKESLSLFLQTLFTGDGSIFKTACSYEFAYSSGSKELLYQVAHLLLRFGIVSKIRYKLAKCNGKSFPHWILTIKNKESVFKFCNEIGFRPGIKKELMIQAQNEIKNLPTNKGWLDLFYDSKSIQQEFEKTEGTKWCKLRDTIISSVKNDGGITRNKIKQMYEQTQNPYFKNLYESEILWDKIVSIKSLGLKQTYDLTVKDHHNFVANDVLVHNTWMLGEFTKAAALSGLKVASFNLEMSLTNMRKRTYMSLTGASDVAGPTIFPCFDCGKNQSDVCRKDERINRVRIPQAFNTKTKYKACTVCKDTDEYEMAMWEEIIDVPRLDYYSVKEKMDALSRIGKASIWLECMPRFSASVNDIERKLDNLESIHNFIPDVLIIDYADILKADDPSLKGVEKEDDVWMCLARIASVRKMLVVVPTQLNKDSLDAKQIKTSHTAKWVGKLGHVDAMFALNQTPPEKLKGVMRVSTLEHRHKDFVETDNCFVLQKYSSGCAHLDSYWKGRPQ